MAKVIDFEEIKSLEILFGMLGKKGFIYLDEDASELLNKVAAGLLKEHLYMLAAVCKERGWHQTGLCLSIGHEHMERMLEEDSLQQSLESLKEYLKEKEGM